MPTPEEELNAVKRSFELGCFSLEGMPEASRATGMPGLALQQMEQLKQKQELSWFATFLGWYLFLIESQ
jgi:hypothetical protein